jgi:YVTN family beta-propeller protein
MTGGVSPIRLRESPDDHDRLTVYGPIRMRAQGRGRQGTGREFVTAMAVSLVSLGSLALAAPASATPLGRSAFVTTGFGNKVYYWPSPANTPANSLPALSAKRVAITPDGAHAYVAGTASDVVVLDIATSPAVSASSPIAVTGASDVAIAPDGTTAYVGSSITSNITKIDIATNAISGTIDNGNSAGNLPNSVAVTPDGSKIVAVTLGRISDSKSVVTVRNTSDGSLVGTPIVLGAGDNADSVAITPDGTKAYVANSANFNTEVINVSSSTLLTTVSSGGNHSGIAITPDGSKAYVPNQNGNDVTIIDTATDTVDSDSPVSTAPGLNPVGIAITPDGSTAYVPNSNAAGPGSVNASVINLATDALATPVSFGTFPGDNPNSAAVTPDQAQRPPSPTLQRRPAPRVASTGRPRPIPMGQSRTTTGIGETALSLSTPDRLRRTPTRLGEPTTSPSQSPITRVARTPSSSRATPPTATTTRSRLRRRP